MTVSKPNRIHHIAVAVDDLDEATEQWSRLGLRLGERDIVEDQGVELQVLHAGDVRIELMRPIREDSPVAQFLAKRGSGLHHVALRAESAAAALCLLEEEGLELIDKAPRTGAHGTKIGFVHPRSLGGVLVEVVEPNPQDLEEDH